MDNLLTVSQYAAAAGISRQAVYRQLKNGKLSKAVVVVDGKKMLDLSQITAPARKETVKQPSRQAFVNSDVDFLRQQIEVKDRQIQDLQRTIDALTDNLKAAQMLHAAAVNVLPAETAPAETPKAETESSETACSESSSQDERPQTESKSFWQRLFSS